MQLKNDFPLFIYFALVSIWDVVLFLQFVEQKEYASNISIYYALIFQN